MKQKRLPLFLLILLVSITAKAYDAKIDGIYYNFSGTEATVTYREYNDYSHSFVSDYSGTVIIPESVTNNSTTYRVTKIGNYSFSGCSSLTSVTIPNSVTSIGSSAFQNCSGLTSVTIPRSVTTIDDYTFSNCNELRSVIIAGRVTSIGGYAFDGCTALTDVYCYATTPPNAYFEYDDGEDYYEYYAFNKSIIQSATLHVPLASIESYRSTDIWSYFGTTVKLKIDFADANLKNYCVWKWDTDGDGELSEVEAAAVTDLGTLFKQRSNITSFDELQYFTGLTSINDNAFNECTNLTSVIIPNSVTSIGEYAFVNCYELTSVTIPESVTSIGYAAFAQCFKLTSMNIPNSVNFIGTAAFSDCASLTSANIPNGVTTINGSTFHGCESLVSITIPNSVTTIISDAFNGCLSLSSITIPNSVTYIGGLTFSGCYFTSDSFVNNTALLDDNNWGATLCDEETIEGLLIKNNSVVKCRCWATSVNIPNGVTSIGDEAFFYSIYSSVLSSVTIPNGVTSIGYRAFMGCSGLTSITIPSSVTSIGESAFYNCSNLTSVKVDIETPVSISIGSTTFPNRANATLIVPAGSKSAYEKADYWKEFKEIIEAEAPSPAIAFADANVKALCVANWDTSHDGELSEAEAAAVTDLGEVFRGNTTITSFNELKYFTSLTTIGNNAFDGCTGLTSIAIPTSLNRVKTEAFKNCTSLSKVIVTDIAAWCGIIYDITSPWDPLGNFPLGLALHLYSDENTEITEVVIPEGVTRIEPLAFRDAKYVTSVTIPNSVTYIGEQAFCGMHRLTSITIPQNITSIESFTFDDCQALTSVTIPEGVITIHDNAFRNCTSLESVSLPESLKHLGAHSFLGCSALPSITIPDGITDLKRVAFQECSNLTTFTYNKAENELTKVDGVYQIGTAEDLCNFAILSTAANADICAQLTADIDYTGYTITGNSLDNHFQHIGLNGYRGTFDGNGHTITVNINNPDSWQIAALFRTLGKGGVIKNLRVAGHVESVSKFSAGIVSELKSGKVSHCVSDVDIVSNIDGDCTDGGIAGIATYDGQESIVEYCVVAGSFQGSNAHHRGGIIGIGRDGNSENITIDNCLFVANVDDLNVTESNTFVRDPISSTHITNCYYLNAMGDASAGTQVTSTQLTSGELCYLLNGDQSSINWTQNLTGNAADSYPLPFSTHAQVYVNGNIYVNEKNYLSMPDTEGIVGGKTTIKVDLRNEDVIGGVQFKVKLPTGMSINTNNNGLKVLGTSRTSGLTVGASYNGQGDYYQVLIYGVGSSITGNSGTIVTLDVSISDALALGNYEVDIYDIAITDVQERLTYPSDVKGTLQLINPKSGDANRDGIINVADIISIANHILGSTPASFDANAANVNGDAVVNVADIITLANMILSGNGASVKGFIFENGPDPE